MIFRIKLFGNSLLIKFLVKTANCTNNGKISFQSRPKLLNYIWKLNLIPRIKLLIRKLIRDKIFTRANLRNVGVDIN